MQSEPTFLIGKGEHPVELLLRNGNRHGLVAGATGTGKTVTMQVLAEGFAAHGVPVFMSDIKGDVSGISQPGTESEKLQKRAADLGVENFKCQGYPVIFWDLFGRQGHPVRGTVSDMGPLLLARLLDLNATQEGILNIAFALADDEGLLLLDFKDLRAILEYVGDNASELKSRYGNVSKASVGAIQRSLLVLEQQGAEEFFAEPALQLTDLMRTSLDGRGYINILAADQLMRSPRLYGTFLLWLLSELFEELPEVGDLDKPRLVFFFDEAHLLFDTAPPSLIEKIEQVVRLIRSKGVGVYFVTQNPTDVPDKVLGQLGNRVQHALRAFTARDQKAVRAAAQTFRARDGLDTEEVITQLGVGEALVSVLDAKGIPTPVERTKIRPPESRMGPATEAERRAVIAGSPIGIFYDKIVDRESAYEMLKKKIAEEEKAKAADEARREREKELERQRKEAERGSRRKSNRMGYGESFMKTMLRTIGSSLGREIFRGILGGRRR